MAVLSQTKRQNWTLKGSPGPNECPPGEKGGRHLWRKNNKSQGVEA